MNKCGIFVLLFFAFLAPISSLATEVVPTKKVFRVFDCTIYPGKSNLEKYGIEPIKIIYADEMFGISIQEFWKRFKKGSKPSVPPPADWLTKLGVKYKSEPLVVLDYEGLKAYDVPKDQYKKDILEYADIIKNFSAGRKGGAGLTGYYGPPPIADLGRLTGGVATPTLRYDNNLLKPLVDVVDVLFPSLYTWDPDFKKWEDMASATLGEAKRIGQGKPIYAFIWPRYHEMNRALDGQLLPAEHWRRQLEFLHERVDGIVIWDGRKDRWNEQWPWWQTTLKFLKSIGKY